MIEAGITVNTVQFEAAMQRLKEGVRRGFIDPQFGLLPVQARLLAERCQTFTPPRSVGQGKAAVARDITNIYRPLSHTTFTQPSIRKIVRTDDRPAWNKVALNFRGSHNLNNTTAMGFTPEWHKRNRTRRGRGVHAKYGNLGFVTLGPEGRQVRRYISEKKKMVGWARAGWNAGIIGFGGSVSTPWVSKHGLGQGSFENGTASPDPFVRVINSTSWAKRSNEGGRIIRNAIQARSRDMESYYFRMMKVAAAKAMQTAA
jgi:hypothetical protein